MGHPEDGHDATDVGPAHVVISTASGPRIVMVGDERARSLAALTAIIDDGVSTTDALRAALQGLPDNASRRRVKDAVIGVGIGRRRLAFVAGRRGLTPSPATLLALHDEGAGAGHDAGPWPADPVEALAVRGSCPDWLAATLIESLGAVDADRFLAASNRPGPVTLRANALRTSADDLVTALAADGIDAVATGHTPWSVDVVQRDGGQANLTGSRAFREGLFEVQDASSQLVAVACGAEPGQVVVDLCAGRGGKTLALAAMIKDRGRVIVNDVDEAALRDLRGRVRRLALQSVEHTAVDDLEGQADVVLVDAPCTSIGVLRRSPDLRDRLQPDDIRALGVTQRALLARACTLVRRGGRVVYATCSVLRSENDDVADTAPDTLERESRRLLLPHRDGGDGFFIASWRRR